MEKKNAYLMILLWIEVIICLLTLITVSIFWMNTHSSGGLTAMTLEERFNLIISIAAFYYTLAGICWLTGYKLARLLHYFGFLLIVCMTAAYLMLSIKVIGTFEPFSMVPVGLILMMVISISLIKEKSA